MSTPSASPPRRPIYQTETTGSYWNDVKEAAQRLSTDDFNRIGEIPCARNSLLNGIAAGAGIGVIRGIGSSPLVAANWAVGTFLVISFGTWHICQNAREQEKKRLQQVVEELPRRFAKKKAAAEEEGKAASS